MKKIILLVLGVILLLVASVVGTLYATGALLAPKSDTPADASADSAAASPPQVAPKNLAYVSLDPAFTISFPESDIASFLQIAIDVAVQDKATEDAMRMHSPAIRNGLVMLLSGQKAEELQTREGKERLRAEILDELRRTLTELTGKPGALDIYFTSFLIQ